MRSRSFLSFLMALALVATARGDSTPGAALPVPVAADAVEAAAKAGRFDLLRAHAALDIPDPWRVASLLLARGSREAALAFAGASSRADTAALRAWVEQWKAQPEADAVRKTIAAARDALGREDHVAALEALAPADPAVGGVLGYDLAALRAQAEGLAHRPVPSAAAWRTAAGIATGMGWLGAAARAWHESGCAEHARGDYAAALDDLRMALALEERRDNDAGQVRTLLRMGAARARLGDYDGAMDDLDTAHATAQRLEDHASSAAALSGLAAVYHRLAQYERALDYHERALGMRERAQDWASAAAVRASMGHVHASLGNYAKALEHYDLALKLHEDLGNPAGAALVLGSIGNVHACLGDFSKAEEYRTLARARAEQWTGRGELPMLLGGIGAVHCDLGNDARAVECYERILALEEQLGREGDRADSLARLGRLYTGLNDHARALKYYEEALALQKELGHRVRAALTLLSIGNVHESLNDPERALAFRTEALAVAEEAGEQATSAAALVGIGSAHSKMGDHVRALEAWRGALALEHELGHRGDEAESLARIADAHEALGEDLSAIEARERAIALARATGYRDVALRQQRALAHTRLVRGELAEALALAEAVARDTDAVARGLAESQVTSAREGAASVFEIGARAAAGLGDADKTAFFLETGRAGALLGTMRNRSALQEAVLSPELAFALSRARARETAAVLAYRESLDGGSRASIRAASGNMDAARTAVEEVMRRIEREAKRAKRILDPTVDDLATICGRLAGDEALVLFGLFEKDPLALVVEKDGARIVALADAEAIVADVEVLLDEIERRADPRAAQAALGRLNLRIIAPLGLRSAVRRVFVSPDGALAHVPFPAVIPDKDVICVPSGTTYGILLEEGLIRGRDILAVGDPDYDAGRAAGARAGTSYGRLPPLPESAEEARAVGDILLLSRDATEARVRDALLGAHPRWRGLHFACHGVIDQERPEASALALTQSDADDGFLTCLEVLGLRIRADLVVLSACETATGKLVRGEGVIGPTRAFLFAGAPRVVCSLWRVDDAATRALMTKFYDLWNPRRGRIGIDASEALRKAQAYVRDQPAWRHPYYWAAWTLWGRAD
ncbi:MAG TPA: CHAT domain-containing protein [Planctomycetota bacterium]|nr:CHAT domain-containing protein [Planctomycetota bacterium]